LPSLLVKAVGVGLGALLLAACSATPASPPQPREGGVAVVALADDPDSLDPTTANTFVSRAVFTSFCEKLYDTNENLEVVPQLAASLPQLSSDGLTVDIKLRTGVLFNDGTPLDAAAVKTTLDRNLMLPTSARKQDLSAVESVNVVDPSTVELKLKRPSSPLTAQLADRAGAIMSPKALQELGDDFGTHPVCVGPFSFTKRVAGSEIDFAKSDYYYDKVKVRLDGVTYKIVSDPTVRTANLRAGGVNVAERINASDVPNLQTDSNITLQKVSTIAYETLSINVDPTTSHSPLATSPQLRSAFEMSIDRNALNKVVFNGEAVPDCNPLPLDQPFRPAGYTCAPSDPAAARKILQESGQQLPIPVELLIAAKQPDQKLAEVIQQMANSVGFQVTINPVELTSANDLADTGQFEVYMVSWSGRIDPDGYFTDVVTTGGSINNGRIADGLLDSLVTQAASVPGNTDRQALYAKVLARLDELKPNVYLYHETRFLGLNGITGVGYAGDAIPRFTTAELTQ